VQQKLCTPGRGGSLRVLLLDIIIFMQFIKPHKSAERFHEITVAGSNVMPVNAAVFK